MGCGRPVSGRYDGSLLCLRRMAGPPTRKACAKVNLGVKPAQYKRMTRAKKVVWHQCYAQHLSHRASRVKKAREARWLRSQVADQLKWAEEIRQGRSHA